MDVAAFNDLPDDLREAAVASFVVFRDKYDSESKESWKQLEDAVRAAKVRRLKYQADVNNRKKYEDLIALLSPQSTGEMNPPAPPSVSPDSDASEDEDEDDGSASSNDGQKGKRISYGALRPKDGLLELIKSTPFFKTDQELLEMLRVHFNIPTIPLKTVTNKLLELQAEKLIARGKFKYTQEFINGLLEWVDDNNKINSEHLQERHRSAKVPE